MGSFALESPPLLTAPPPRPDVAPRAAFAQPSFDPPTLTMPAHAAALVQLALAYAAAAERRLAEQAARIAELENLSITDPLTGLLNRRGFDDALRRCLANAQRHGEQGLVVYLDLDGFKAVNDRLGHDAGDAVLRHVADVLRREVRATDYVARLGGDEFALLLIRADRAAKDPITGKLGAALSAQTVRFGGHRIPVRASLGAARYDRASPQEAVLAAADRAMYRDKAKSRDRAKKFGRAA